MKKAIFSFSTLLSLLAMTSLVAAQDAALIQAAKKEGKVVWYTSLALPSSTAIAHYFEKKYHNFLGQSLARPSLKPLQCLSQQTLCGAL